MRTVSKRIKGITIEIGAETTGLDKALKGVEKTTRDINSELRDVNKLLKFSPKDTELLSQKQKLLSDQVKTTSEKLQELKNAEADVQRQFESGDIKEEQYRAFQREIVETESKLKHYQKQLKEVTSGHIELGKKLEDTGRKLQTAGGKIKGVGDSLTKKLTLPALGVTAAVGGMVASFGWKRLVGIDAAQSQLRGLGYEVKDVERISAQVSSAVQGTTMTMAEGTSAAAGALAAGVGEGAELERFLKSVANAAVGAGRDVGSMAQIFNRVQGSGKLMTQELNMIEDGMPGFSQAMAKSFGVTQEEFRKMVTDGKVSSAKFLDVMDEFAGDMADSYANSWDGMVSNTKANIGIIGESLLGGVFEQSKESVGEFLDFLRSDDIREWATEMGESIGETFGKVVENIKGAIEWWNGLSEGKQEIIKKAALLAIAMGPVISTVGKVTGGVGKAIETGGKLVENWDKIKADGSLLSGGLKASVGSLFSPAGLIIAGIAAAIAIGVLLYKNWDTITAKAQELWINVKEKFAAVRDAIVLPIEAAKLAVEKVIDSIKGFFTNLRLKFPKIEMPKLPKFELKGGFSLKPLSVPKLGIKWNADGGIFTQPTIIPALGGLQGFGEPRTGGEAILPLNRLSGLMAEAINQVGGMSNTIVIQKMNVRDESDIEKIASELYHLQDRKRRGRG